MVTRHPAVSAGHGPDRLLAPHALVVGRRHLERVLGGYVARYNARRPHRGLDLRAPDAPRDPPVPVSTLGGVRRRALLGGLIHEYEPAA